MKNNASKPFSASQNMRPLCHLEEINHPLAHQSRESAIGNNTSKERILSMYKPQSVFVLCDKCHWCVTWLDKTKMSAYDKCPQCTNSEMLSSFPILPDESFTFDYSKKKGVELDFKRRKK